MYCGVVVIENHTSTDATAASEGSQGGSQDSQSSQGPVGRTLIIQGDHNPIPDRYPVNADAYLGKMVGCVDYIGAVLLFFCERFNLIIIITTVSVTVVTILMRSNTFTA